MDHPLGRRVAAARLLAGHRSQEALAQAVARPGMSARTIRNVESGRRGLAEHEREWIARACGLDPLFFELDLSRLSAPARPDAQLLAHELLEAAQQILQRAREGDEEQDGQDRPR
ncbi:MAG TPA: helix-turn-helix transcriptional regulator [Phycisphaerales bacterium]|nr:helix-turn-helix transcriptional regulator [Phycisphaerales bacterium]